MYTACCRSCRLPLTCDLEVVFRQVRDGTSVVVQNDGVDGGEVGRGPKDGLVGRRRRVTLSGRQRHQREDQQTKEAQTPHRSPSVACRDRWTLECHASIRQGHKQKSDQSDGRESGRLCTENQVSSDLEFENVLILDPPVWANRQSSNLSCRDPLEVGSWQSGVDPKHRWRRRDNAPHRIGPGTPGPPTAASRFRPSTS